jgi:hypothetical protein
LVHKNWTNMKIWSCFYIFYIGTVRVNEFPVRYIRLGGPGSSVGIATGYGLDGPGSESRWGRDFSAHVQTGPGAHSASCTVGNESFQGVESGRGVTLTLHPLLVPRSRNRVQLYLYFPWGPSWLLKMVKPIYIRLDQTFCNNTGVFTAVPSNTKKIQRQLFDWQEEYPEDTLDSEEVRKCTNTV